MPLLDKTEADHDSPPDDDDRRQEDAGTKFAEDDGGGRLQSDVCDEEQQDDDAVTFAGELEVGAHTSDHGDAQIGPVHEGHTVHEAEGGNQAKIDLTNDLLLLLRSEGVDSIIVELRLSRVNALDLGNAGLLVDERHRNVDVIGVDGGLMERSL